MEKLRSQRGRLWFLLLESRVNSSWTDWSPASILVSDYFSAIGVQEWATPNDFAPKCRQIYTCILMGTRGAYKLSTEDMMRAHSSTTLSTKGSWQIFLDSGLRHSGFFQCFKLQTILQWMILIFELWLTASLTHFSTLHKPIPLVSGRN